MVQSLAIAVARVGIATVRQFLSLLYNHNSRRDDHAIPPDSPKGRSGCMCDQINVGDHDPPGIRVLILLYSHKVQQPPLPILPPHLPRDPNDRGLCVDVVSGCCLEVGNDQPAGVDAGGPATQQVQGEWQALGNGCLVLLQDLFLHQSARLQLVMQL